MKLNSDLDQQEKEVTELLSEKIRARINESAGKIPFSEFMQLALYYPNLGYYANGKKKLGKGGDFITAPMVSPLFSRCLARQCLEVLSAIPDSSIFEFGAGSGQMCADILSYLAEQNCLPEQYFILEPSSSFRKAQKTFFESYFSNKKYLLDLITWLDRLPEKNFQGVILANEVLDAFPVERFFWDKQTLLQEHVIIKADGFATRFLPFTEKKLIDFFYHQVLPDLEESEKRTGFFPEHYVSEMQTLIAPWLNSVRSFLSQGVLIIIDYGFSGTTFFHPDRNQGTLMCHYQQYSHPDPFFLIGLQDITTHINFTQVEREAEAVGFKLSGITTQAQFLLNLGLLSDPLLGEEQNYLRHAQAIKKLTLPHEMGDLFKVMSLNIDFDKPLSGFA